MNRDYSSPNSYIKLNEQTYNSLSAVYESRMTEYIERDQNLLTPLWEYLSTHFHNTIRVMDIGPGAGLDLAILAKQGCYVTGVDIASEMLKISRRTCPQAVLLHANILEVSFHKESFEGLIAKATLHLFSQTDAQLLLGKMMDWLVPRGMAYITTTIAETPDEGFQPKLDYPVALVRYRKQWTETELLDSLKQIGFEISLITYDVEEKLHKRWINAYVIKGA